MNTYVDVLLYALNNVDNLKSNLADWSNIKEQVYSHENQIAKDEYRNAWLHTSRTYKDTIWGVTFKNLVGESLSTQCTDPVYILDVGCGHKSTFNNLVKGNDVSRFKYTSIDKDASVEPSIVADVFCEYDKQKIYTELQEYTYNVIIIDIEPHSKEIEIYELFKKFMKHDHLVILKCVGFIDFYGSFYADRFIKKLFDEKQLVDYFAVSELNIMTRDVFIVVGHDVDFRRTITSKIEERGGRQESWFRLHADTDDIELSMVYNINRKRFFNQASK